MTALHPDLAFAVARIFDGHGSVADGRLFEAYLNDVARSLSIFDATGEMNSDRMTAVFEGQRALAIKLLGARADVAILALGDKDDA